jgi:hypothetical protein
MPAVGRATRGYPTYAAGVEFGKILSRRVHHLPGGHIGHVIESTQFASELLAALT